MGSIRQRYWRGASPARRPSDRSGGRPRRGRSTGRDPRARAHRATRGRGPRPDAGLRRVPFRPARPRRRVGSTDADRDGPRGCRGGRGGRAGRDVATGRRARGAGLAHPVRGLPVVPARPVWACPDSPSYRHALLDGETRRSAAGRRAVATARSPRWPRQRSCRPRRRSRSPTALDPAAAALIGCCVTTGVGAVLKTAAVPGGFVGGRHRARRRRAVVRDGRGRRRRVADRGHRPGAGKLDAARSVGATDTLLAGDDPGRHGRGASRPDRRRPRLRLRGDRPADRPWSSPSPPCRSAGRPCSSA